jgi:secretion/DNA translocation related TadE-like protein
VPGERGSGSVLVLAAVLAVVTVLAGALLVAAAVRDVHRARGAADLAALAAALPLASGGSVGCARARTVAAAAGAELVECRLLADGTVRVRTRVPAGWAAGWPGLPAAVHGTARAGPTTEAGDAGEAPPGRTRRPG